MRIPPVFITLLFLLSVFLLTNADLWSGGKEIVLEDYWYYVIHPDGKKVSIGPYRTGGEPRVEVIFSPDSSYVAYTIGNGTGWEGQGRDLCYCKTDGSERTVILSSDASIRYLYWIKVLEKEYIVFVHWATGFEGMGHVKVYDFHQHQIVFDTLGTSLVRIGDTAKFLVSDYLFSWRMAYILDLGGSVPQISGFEGLAETKSVTKSSSCVHARLQQTKPELRVAPVGFIPAYWPHDSYNVSEYVDLVRKAFEFTRLSCLVLSPNQRFVAFSATGDRFTCNGILDTKSHKTHALRFFLGSFDGQPCWSPNSEYVAFINLVGGRGKYINVFSIDSVLSSKNPMIIKKNFERPTDKSFEICFSLDSDTLYYEASGWGKPDSGKLTIRR